MTKKTKTKKTAKTSKVDNTAYEVGNFCVHALALFTNAVIRKRTEDAVEVFIPLTLAVGKKKEVLEITYQADLKTLSDYHYEDTSLAGLGEFMFKSLCDTIRESEVIVDIVGKPFKALTKFEVITDYKDKCVYKDGTMTFVKAGQPKSKKK